MKLSPAVKKETVHIAIGEVAFGALLCGGMALAGKWSLSVLWGALLGSGWAVLSFLLLGITVQKAADTEDEKRRSNIMQLSYSLRNLGMLGVCVLGLTLPMFHWLPVIAAQLFPRITIFISQMIYKDETPAPAPAQPAAQQSTPAPEKDAAAEYKASLAKKGTRAMLEEILHDNEEET